MEDESSPPRALRPPPPPSVRSAVAFWAVLMGIFSLVFANWYNERPRGYSDVTLVLVNCGFAYVILVSDISLIYCILNRKDKTLKSILPSIMALNIFCALLSTFTIVFSASCGFVDVPMMETSRLTMFIYHLYLMYRLLDELKGVGIPENSTTGWFERNLGVRQPGAITSDKALEKQRSEPATIYNPALLPPTVCINLAPVHHPKGAAALSGPPSCTDA